MTDLGDSPLDLDYGWEGERPVFIRFARGTKIVCPECHQELSECVRNILSNEAMLSEPWSDIEFGSLPECKECGASYIKQDGSKIMLHTDQGWI